MTHVRYIKLRRIKAVQMIYEMQLYIEKPISQNHETSSDMLVTLPMEVNNK